MLVDSTQVQEAKKKIANRNASIIADLMHLEQYDPKNMKACCPYHKEDTPSFIYNPKTYNFHCFGCGANADLVDALMQTGMTYVEACKNVFDYARMDYSFGEVGVKTKAQYKYPHDENGSVEDIKDYWGRRGISEETLEYLNITSDGHGNTVFKYYDENDVLTMVKYRPARTIHKGEVKTWCQKDADTTPLLFNMNRINTSQPLAIVEGEGDVASAIEAGFYNVVSVPLGCQNLHWIEENWDWLDQFNSIIVAFDNDEPGTKARKEVIYRLGTWRTKYIDYPQYKEEDGRRIKIKDMNDVLQAFGSLYVMSMITNAKDIPVSSVVDFTEVDDLDISDMSGIQTGIKPLDSELIRIFDGTLTLLSGRPGSGKTSLIDQIIAHSIDSGSSAFLFSKEMPERMSTNWFNFILAGRRNLVEKESASGQKYNVVSFEAKTKIRDFYSKKLFLYKDDEPNDVESVMKSMEECVRKYGVKLLVIDNLMMLDLKCSEESKYTAQTQLINDLIRFAAKFNVAVVLVAHPRKTQDMQSDIEMYDISGSSNIINLAMRSIGLRRVTKKEKEDANNKFHDYDVVLTVMKDRILGKTDIAMGMHYDIKSRRFFTNYEEFDHQYGWDKAVYTDEIEYPVERTPFE